jgi:glycosyltransferase involved in cell wall biosynthesis
VSGPLISCVIPVFNGERYLAAAVRSISGQSHRPLEIIVVDDGSTDGTASVVESLGTEVRYFRQANAGPVVARNYGLAKADGELLAFLDSDDLWHSEKLSRQLARFRERPELAYSVTLVQNFWEDDVSDERERMKNHPRAKPIPGFVTDTLMVTREWLVATGGFDTSLAHGDSADWFSRVDALGGVGELLPEVLVFRRIHRASFSRQLAGESREEFLHVLKRRLDHRRRQSP